MCESRKEKNSDWMGGLMILSFIGAAGVWAILYGSGLNEYLSFGIACLAYLGMIFGGSARILRDQVRKKQAEADEEVEEDHAA